MTNYLRNNQMNVWMCACVGFIELTTFVLCQPLCSLFDATPNACLMPIASTISRPIENWMCLQLVASTNRISSAPSAINGHNNGNFLKRSNLIVISDQGIMTFRWVTILAGSLHYAPKSSVWRLRSA